MNHTIQNPDSMGKLTKSKLSSETPWFEFYGTDTGYFKTRYLANKLYRPIDFSTTTREEIAANDKPSTGTTEVIYKYTVEIGKSSWKAAGLQLERPLSEEIRRLSNLFDKGAEKFLSPSEIKFLYNAKLQLKVGSKITKFKMQDAASAPQGTALYERLKKSKSETIIDARIDHISNSSGKAKLSGNPHQNDGKHQNMGDVKYGPRAAIIASEEQHRSDIKVYLGRNGPILDECDIIQKRFIEANNRIYETIRREPQIASMAICSCLLLKKMGSFEDWLAAVERTEPEPYLPHSISDSSG